MRQMNNEFVIFQTQESAVMIYWFVSCCARQQEDLTLEVLFPKQYIEVGIGKAGRYPHLSVEQLLLARVWDMVMEPWRVGREALPTVLQTAGTVCWACARGC